MKPHLWVLPSHEATSKPFRLTDSRATWSRRRGRLWASGKPLMHIRKRESFGGHYFLNCNGMTNSGICNSCRTAYTESCFRLNIPDTLQDLLFLTSTPGDTFRNTSANSINCLLWLLHRMHFHSFAGLRCGSHLQRPIQHSSHFKRLAFLDVNC